MVMGTAETKGWLRELTDQEWPPRRRKESSRLG